jgi:hypothetical protein
MNTVAAPSRPVAHARASRVLGTAIVALVVVGMYLANSMEQLFAYLIVVCAAVIPSLLWVRMGALGIPVFPAVALSYIPYFAFPMVSVSDNVSTYSSSEVLRSGLTVALFLFSATGAWRAIVGLRRPRFTFDVVQFSASQVTRLIILGYAMGILFYLSLLSEWLEILGSFYGVVRTLVVTFVTIACFLSGVTHAQGILRGTSWRLVIVAVVLIISMAWSSLFLVGGMIYALALIFGYVVVARRIPWLVAGALLAVVVVLHAGKGEIRAKYWGPETNYGGITSATQIPALAAEWVGQGVKTIALGEVEQSAFERTSLLEMILRVQALTPDSIDFLNGETYALLPAIIVPRFIDPDKPTSQAGIILLNFRYGIQTLEESAITAIGWGLVPEAYANFGYLGVAGMGLVLGFFCGGLAVWGAHAQLVSLPVLFSIAAMMILINIEVDFIQVSSTLFQVFVSVFVFTTLYRWLTQREMRRTHGA